MQRHGHRHAQLRSQIETQTPEHTQRHTTRESQSRTHWRNTNEHACRHVCMHGADLIPNLLQCRHTCTPSYIQSSIHTFRRFVSHLYTHACVQLTCMLVIRHASIYADRSYIIQTSTQSCMHTPRETDIHTQTLQARQTRKQS